jgi:putative intracellular protease/amidase
MTRTIILAWVIGVLGLIMIIGGIWGVIDLFRQEVRAPLKSYGGPISMICGGVAMLGVAQLLRLELVLILVHAQ